MADTDPHAGIDMGDAALGAALSNATAAGILCETCEVADFYTETQRAIFRAIVMLRQVGGTPDERVVADALPAHCNYILGLPGLCPAATNVRTYIERLKKHRWHRNLKAAAQKLVDISGNGAQPETLTAWYQEAGPLFAGPARPSAKPAVAERSWPQPLGEAAYHGPLGGLVKAWAPHNEADPAALLVTVLAGWGSVVGPGPHHFVGDDRHPARLFACVVGRSSAARKGMSAGPPLAVLIEIDPEWAEHCRASGLSSGEGLIYRVRNPKWESKGAGKEPKMTDPGVADKRLLVQEAEFARVFTVMARKDNTLSAIIRDLYDTGSAAVMTKGPHDRTTNAHVCVVAHITAEELQRALSNVDAGNGFANRFLWVCAERQKPLPFGGMAARAELEPHIHALQGAAGHIGAGELDGDIPWAEDAKPLWIARYEGLMPDVPGILGKAIARGQPQVLRIALLYALADCCREIRRVHLEAALEVWRYCAESARYIFGEKTGDRTADRILDAIRCSGSLNRTQINVLFAGNKTKAEIDRALQCLESAGRIKRATPAEGAGRPAEVWQTCAGPDADAKGKDV